MNTALRNRFGGKKRGVLLGSAFLLGAFFCCAGGCRQERLASPARLAEVSASYYRQAVAGYQEGLLRGIDTDRTHAALGRLYFDHAEFEKALEHLRQSALPEARKYLGITLYRLGQYTDALEVLRTHDPVDEEMRYFRALTAEKLNLFDQALQHYRLITQPAFAGRAAERIGAIERQMGLVHIRDAAPEISALIAAAPGKERYPQAGALILLCDERLSVGPGNGQETSLHYVIKILNERGKEAFSELPLEYDSTYEKIELEYARTIKPDGTVVDVGTRHLRDVSKYLNFPLYSNARVLIISFPEVAVGSVVEYRARIVSHELINGKDFVLRYPVQSGEPIMRAALQVSLPPGRRLSSLLLNEEYNSFGVKMQPVVTETARGPAYEWVMADIPQIIPEPLMPEEARINPTVLLSTFDDWQEVYEWWWNLAKDKIRADEAIQAKIGELLRSARSPRERAEALYEYCAQEIRYVAVEYGEAGYEPHAAADIFRNKYGDCKDQAVLLVTMLRAAGLPGWPVLIPTKELPDMRADFSTVLFNHCIAATEIDGETVFLDPTAQTCSFGDLPLGDQDRTVLLCGPDGYRILRTPAFAAAHNLLKQDLKLWVQADAESVLAERTVLSYGLNAQAMRHWFLFTPPELIEQELAGRIQDFSIGAQLSRYETRNAAGLGETPLLRYSFRGPEYFARAGSLRIIPQLPSLDVSAVALARRSYPLEFECLEAKENEFQIELPASLSVLSLPESFFEDSPWLSFTVAYRQKKNTIFFRQELVRKKSTVPLPEYAAFREFMQRLAYRCKQHIVLRQNKLSQGQKE